MKGKTNVIVVNGGGSGGSIPPVTNLAVDNNYILSWVAPDLSSFEGTGSYLVKINGTVVDEVTTTSINIGGYLQAGNNTITVTVKLTSDDDTEIVYYLSEPTITTLSITLPQAVNQTNCEIVGTNAYILGTQVSSTFTTNIYKFDLISETFTLLQTALPSSDRQRGSCAVGTNIYLFGGLSNGTVIYKFDTTTETVTTLQTTLIASSRMMGVASYGTNIYLFGGFGTTQKIYKFDTTNETITEIGTTLPISVTSCTTATIGNLIYLFGGTNLTTILKFNATTEAISTLSTTLPQNKESMGASVYGTNVYLFGGGTTSSGSTSATKTIYKFDSSNETITTLSIEMANAKNNTYTAKHNNDTYIFGGYNALDISKFTV